jgi:hypothetical protein
MDQHTLPLLLCLLVDCYEYGARRKAFSNSQIFFEVLHSEQQMGLSVFSYCR